MKRIVWLFLVLSSTAWGWDFRGHRVVAAIALDYLAPSTREWVENCLEEHPDASLHSWEGAAIWPDRIRGERPETNSWHFISFPLGPSGPPPLDRDQIVWAIAQMREQAAISGRSPKRAEALAFLIHLIGDIHQPLHACGYYSPEYPEGDQGGGRVPLHHPWAMNLHHYWDSAGEPPEVSAAELKTRAVRVAAGPQAALIDPLAWAQESLELARQSGYPGGRPPGPELSEEYQQKARQICLQRLFLAGLRLTYVLEKLGPQGARY